MGQTGSLLPSSQIACPGSARGSTPTAPRTMATEPSPCRLVHHWVLPRMRDWTERARGVQLGRQVQLVPGLVVDLLPPCLQTWQSRGKTTAKDLRQMHIDTPPSDLPTVAAAAALQDLERALCGVLHCDRAPHLQWEQFPLRLVPLEGPPGVVHQTAPVQKEATEVLDACKARATLCGDRGGTCAAVQAAKAVCDALSTGYAVEKLDSNGKVAARREVGCGGYPLAPEGWAEPTIASFNKLVLAGGCHPCIAQQSGPHCDAVPAGRPVGRLTKMASSPSSSQRRLSRSSHSMGECSTACC